jgi:hypothetical protein
MTSTGYDRLVRGIVEKVAGATFKRSESQPPLVSPQPPQIRGRGSIQGRVDLSSRRQGWVSGNDTVAHRNYGEQTRGLEAAEATEDSGEAEAEAKKRRKTLLRSQVQPIWQKIDSVNSIVL